MLGEGPDAPTALIIEPAGAYELAPLAAAAHGLTIRERSITELVARGYGTDDIAHQLHLSAWTVQDHLKSIFDKVRVRTRGELIARLFFEHRSPRLSDHSPVRIASPGRDRNYPAGW
jgi:DNA-binding CsgD family transcriptional regulator